MAIFFKNLKFRILELLPLVLLFFTAFIGKSIIDIVFFTINIHYIIIYYWVLKNPQFLGYGFIFLSGVVTDVILGFPIGANALALLVIASVAAYARLVTVKASLFTDWLSFIPALLLANFIFFISLYLSNFSISYINLLFSSISTFIFYPMLWLIFGIFSNFIRSGSHA